MLLGAVLNVVLDPLYLFVFQWGVKGAALATITSQFVSACIMVFYFTKKSNIMKLRRTALHPNVKLCLEIIKLGTSAGIACRYFLGSNHSNFHYSGNKKTQREILKDGRRITILSIVRHGLRM